MPATSFVLVPARLASSFEYRLNGRRVTLRKRQD
jgi:hypothetical protein